MHTILKNLVILYFIIPIGGCAQGKSNGNLAPVTIIDNFYDNYHTYGIDKALDYIFLTNKWLNISDSSIISLKIQLAATIKLLGKYQGYEQITKKQIGNNYLLYSYLTRYERQPLRFTFIFYRVNDNWQLQHFKYDVDFDAELEKAAEVYLLKENYKE